MVEQIRKLSWPAVVLAIACISAVLIALVMDVETGDLVLIVVAILLGTGIGKIGTIQQQTNGAHSAMLEALRQAQSEQAALVRQLAETITLTQPGQPRDPGQPGPGE